MSPQVPSAMVWGPGVGGANKTPSPRASPVPERTGDPRVFQLYLKTTEFQTTGGARPGAREGGRAAASGICGRAELARTLSCLQPGVVEAALWGRLLVAGGRGGGLVAGWALLLEATRGPQRD